MADEEEFKIGRRCFDLKDHFRQAGDVVFTQVMHDSDGYSRGWGIVEFSTPEEALKAVEDLNDSELEGRRILVREDREDRDVKEHDGSSSRPRGRGRGRAPPPGGRRGRRGAGRAPVGGRSSDSSSGLQPVRQVVVHNLPYSFTWRDLKDMFQEEYAVERADIVHGADGRSKGFGIVLFETKEEAQAAIKAFDGKEIEGRTVTVKLDQYG